MKLFLTMMATGTMAFAAAPTTKTATTTTTTMHKTAGATDAADGAISANVQAANDAEIAAGKMAETKATNPQVKAFAKHMVEEHTANNKQTMTLDKELKVTSTPDANAQQMKTDADAKLADLQTKSGADFDKAYMTLQVQMHEQVLNAISTALLPKAQNPEMKTFLTTTKTHVEQHLAQAKKIQSTLK